VPDAVFQARDNGKTVSVPIGQRFRIELEENPTTGYKWTVPEFDQTCLALEMDEYTPAKTSGIGGGGIRQFVFAIKSACRVTLRMVNKRPWETDGEPAARFEITIVGSKQQ
jgi:inhibitor of cysteine peptidase